MTTPILLFPEDSSVLGLVSDLCFGLILGILVVGVLYFLESKVAEFRSLSRRLSHLMGRLGKLEIFFLAAFSSLAEELFFRGLLQHYLGLLIASLIFGFLHSGWSKSYRWWAITSFLLGVFLGLTYVWTQSIFVPIAIHFTINYVNLWIMQKGKSKAPSNLN